MISSRQLAEHFGVTVQTVRAWAKTGRVPSYLMARGRFYFDLDAVKRSLRTGTPDHKPHCRATAVWMLLSRGLVVSARRSYQHLDRDGRDWINRKCDVARIPRLDS